MELTTKERLIEAGMAMLLEQGYNHLGIQELLTATSVPKGSFYHHFASKEEFALAVVDQYMAGVHQGLDACLGDASQPPLSRIRAFFEAVRESYRQEGYLGCLLGGLGQELSGVNDVFRGRIEQCFSTIANRLSDCLGAAVEAGDLPPETDVRHLANLIVNCWEGAALRTRMLRDPAPLEAMLDFVFQSIPQGAGMPARRKKRAAKKRRA